MYFMSVNKFKPDVDLSLVNKTIVAHRAWAKEQLAADILVQAGKWGAHGGMIIIKAETREEADRVVNEDPLVRAGLITFETAELHAAVAYK
ncbi:MAG TPA: YciI family protein [Nitrospirota bacterium]|nr:YciI family protein [Nitrospirota bacterium]